MKLATTLLSTFLLLTQGILSGESVTETSPPMEPSTESESERIDSSNQNNPGIVANRGGEWLWSDHLFNLTENIDVAVEIVKPDNITLDVDTDELEKIVSDVFDKEGIIPEAAPKIGQPELPRFNINILVYPIPQGYAYALSARLFESVKLERVKLVEAVTMQAITWDRNSINIVSKGNFKANLEANVKEVAKDFADRYTFFEKYRKRNEP